jgi:hypothetical protein
MARDDFFEIYTHQWPVSLLSFLILSHERRHRPGIRRELTINTSWIKTSIGNLGKH